MIPRIALAASLCALGCTNVTELADWAGDAGGQETDTDVGDIIEMDCGDCAAAGTEMSNLLCALDLCDGSYVLAGGNAEDYVALTTYRSGDTPFSDCGLDDTRAAVSGWGDPDNDLEPKVNGSYAIMATGDWDVGYHNTSCWPDVEGDGGTDSLEYDDNKPTEAIYDAVEWRLTLRAPPDALSFSFDYVFFSAEYEEALPYLSQYNDKFYAVLEAGSTNAGTATVINFTACRDDETYSDFVCDSDLASSTGCTWGVKYCYIAINSALSECCNYECNEAAVNPAETSIEGTGYECAPNLSEDGAGYGSSTGWLHTRWRIEPNEEFTLTFHIHDTYDSQVDSSVILDAFQFHRSFQAGGTVVIE